jgi:hypothetical protein
MNNSPKQFLICLFSEFSQILQHVSGEKRNVENLTNAGEKKGENTKRRVLSMKFVFARFLCLITWESHDSHVIGIALSRFRDLLQARLD